MTKFNYIESIWVVERMEKGETLSEALRNVFTPWLQPHNPIGAVADEAVYLMTGHKPTCPCQNIVGDEICSKNCEECSC